MSNHTSRIPPPSSRRATLHGVSPVLSQLEPQGDTQTPCWTKTIICDASLRRFLTRLIQVPAAHCFPYCVVCVCACLRLRAQPHRRATRTNRLGCCVLVWSTMVLTHTCTVLFSTAVARSPTVDIVPKRKKHGALAKLIYSGSLAAQASRQEAHTRSSTSTSRHTPLPVLDQIHIVEDRDEYKTLAEPVCSLFRVDSFSYLKGVSTPSQIPLDAICPFSASSPPSFLYLQ